MEAYSLFQQIIRCGDLESYPLLEFLDLSHSHIQEIEDDTFGRLEMLETLFLDNNQLKSIPSSLPTSLEHLFLQSNEITEVLKTEGSLLDTSTNLPATTTTTPELSRVDQLNEQEKLHSTHIQDRQSEIRFINKNEI
uniref:Uncharacterized protein n=1 Tax=Megaselia scalaris TaxID=36166 RepID=T1GAB4_MEGSC